MKLAKLVRNQFDTFDWFINHKNTLKVLKNAIHEEITVSARLNSMYIYKTLGLAFLLYTDWHVALAVNVANRLSIDLIYAVYTSQILAGVLLLIFINMILIEIPAGIILGIWRRLSVYKNQAIYKKNKLKK
jgi:hypothetical protein